MKVLGEVRDRYGFALVGCVVIPEHIHLLMGEPACGRQAQQGTPSTVMQVLKQRVSRKLRGKVRSSEDRGQLRLRFGEEHQLQQFWQRRFHDFNVWSAKKRTEKLEYMHLNPVKRKLVSHPKDWPWSSYAAYSGKGTSLITIDTKD